MSANPLNTPTNGTAAQTLHIDAQFKLIAKLNEIEFLDSHTFLDSPFTYKLEKKTNVLVPPPSTTTVPKTADNPFSGFKTKNAQTTAVDDKIGKLVKSIRDKIELKDLVKHYMAITNSKKINAAPQGKHNAALKRTPRMRAVPDTVYDDYGEMILVNRLGGPVTYHAAKIGKDIEYTLTTLLPVTSLSQLHSKALLGQKQTSQKQPGYLSNTASFALKRKVGSQRSQFSVGPIGSTLSSSTTTPSTASLRRSQGSRASSTSSY